MPSRSFGSVRVFYPLKNRKQVISEITRTLPRLKQQLPVVRLALFGSYARDEHTVSSDIDLLVVYEGASRPDAFSVVKKTIALPRLEPHVYSEDEFAQVRTTLESMLAKGSVEFA